MQKPTDSKDRSRSLGTRGATQSHLGPRRPARRGLGPPGSVQRFKDLINFMSLKESIFAIYQ